MANLMHCILHAIMALLLAIYGKKDKKKYLHRMWLLIGVIWAIIALIYIFIEVMIYRLG